MTVSPSPKPGWQLNAAIRDAERLGYDDLVLSPRFAREVLTALESAQAEIARLTTVVGQCRNKFAEYVKLHEAKLLPERAPDEFYQNARTAHNEDVRKKVERNQEMVDLCSAALKGNQP